MIDFERGERAEGERAQKELSGRQYPIVVLTRLWLARHVQNQSRITLMRRICSFHGFFYSIMICLRLPGAMIVTDYLLLKAIQPRIGANAIRVRFATEFF